MTTTPEERGRFIVKVLDTALSGVFPSEDEIGALAPHVDQINKRYGEMRGKSFREASIASRAEFIAQSIREAEDAAEQRAIDRCRHIIATAIVGNGDAEAMRRLLLAAFDPTWDKIVSIINPKD